MKFIYYYFFLKNLFRKLFIYFEEIISLIIPSTIPPFTIMLDSNSEPQLVEYHRSSDIQPEELVSFISLPHYELHKLINDPGNFFLIQKTSWKKSPNLTTKPNKKYKKPSSSRPSCFWIKPKKFYNMQRGPEKILTGISLFVSFTTYPVPIVTFGSSPNARLTSKVSLLLFKVSFLILTTKSPPFRVPSRPPKSIKTHMKKPPLIKSRNPSLFINLSFWQPILNSSNIKLPLTLEKKLSSHSKIFLPKTKFTSSDLWKKSMKLSTKTPRNIQSPLIKNSTIILSRLDTASSLKFLFLVITSISKPIKISLKQLISHTKFLAKKNTLDKIILFPLSSENTRLETSCNSSRCHFLKKKILKKPGKATIVRFKLNVQKKVLFSNSFYFRLLSFP